MTTTTPAMGWLSVMEENAFRDGQDSKLLYNGSSLTVHFITGEYGTRGQFAYAVGWAYVTRDKAIKVLEGAA